MPKKIRYVSHDGREFTFDMSGSYKLRGTESKDYDWECVTIGGRIAGFSRTPNGVGLDVVISGAGSLSARDAFYEAADGDVMANSPGRIYDGDFYREGFFVGSRKSGWFNDYRAETKLTFMPTGNGGSARRHTRCPPASTRTGSTSRSTTNTTSRPPPPPRRYLTADSCLPR